MRGDRLISMVLLLQTRGKMTAAALASELAVSRRTILRDVEALALTGIPIYAEGGHAGGIALDEHYRTTLTGLTENEVRSLFIASGTQLLHEVGLGAAAESTLLKLTAALPARHQSALEQFRQRLYIDPLWWWHEAQPPAFWADLQTAVYEDRCIRAQYENYNGEIAERLLEPYSLVAKSGSWYLIAKRGDDLRTYRVSRFRGVTLLDTPFVRAADFDLVAYWQEHLGEFVSHFSGYEFTLRVHPDRIQFVRWLMPGRGVTLATDAHGWALMRLQIDSSEMAKMLVFGLGGDCEIIDPPALRAELIATCHTLLNRLAPASD